MFLQAFVGPQSSSRSAPSSPLARPTPRAAPRGTSSALLESSSTIPPRQMSGATVHAPGYVGSAGSSTLASTPACTASASARIETAISAGVSGADVEAGRAVDAAQVGDRRGRPASRPGPAGSAARPERADVADVARPARPPAPGRRARASWLITTSLSSAASPAMQPVAVADVGDGLRLPAEQRGGRTERLGDRAAADDHQLRDRPQDRDDASVGRGRSRSPGGRSSSATSSPASAIVSGCTSRRAHDLAVTAELGSPRQTGSRSAAAPTARPAGRRPGPAGSARRPPQGRPATSASTSPTCRSRSRPLPPRAARSASWSSSAPDRSEPTRPPPGVMASASVRSTRSRPSVSTTHATSTRVPARRQATTLNAIPYTMRSLGVLGRGHTRGGGVPDRSVRPRAASDRRGHAAGAGLERLRRARHR